MSQKQSKTSSKHKTQYKCPGERAHCLNPIVKCKEAGAVYVYGLTNVALSNLTTVWSGT